jgi:hypothetical protein
LQKDKDALAAIEKRMAAMALATSSPSTSSTAAAPSKKPIVLHGVPKPQGTRTVFRDGASPLRLPAAAEAELAEQMEAQESEHFEGHNDDAGEAREGGASLQIEAQLGVQAAGQ